jgi:hypothetical protein
VVRTRRGERGLSGQDLIIGVRPTRGFLTVKVTSDRVSLGGDPTFNPVTRAFSGGDGIRTHGLYIANVVFSAF